MNFVQKGKKQLNPTQLTPEGSKKLNTRDTITPWERNITMVKDLLDEIIYSEFPLVISPIFAHLGNKQPQGKPTKKKQAERKKITKPLSKKIIKLKKLGFKCGICTKEFSTPKLLNNHCSSLHPKLNLVCKESPCDFKTKLAQELKDHIKDMHERNVCKECNTITVGTAHKQNHENAVHGTETQPHATNKKPWIQPKKTFINRKIKKLQREVSILNKDGNIYNNLLTIPEIPDLEKIKKYFKTVTTEQCKAALDRLDKWVAKEKNQKQKLKFGKIS